MVVRLRLDANEWARIHPSAAFSRIYIYLYTRTEFSLSAMVFWCEATTGSLPLHQPTNQHISHTFVLALFVYKINVYTWVSTQRHASCVATCSLLRAAIVCATCYFIMQTPRSDANRSIKAFAFSSFLFPLSDADLDADIKVCFMEIQIPAY